MDPNHQSSLAGPGPSSLAHHLAQHGRPTSSHRQQALPQTLQHAPINLSEIRPKEEPPSSGSSQDAEGENANGDRANCKSNGKMGKDEGKARRPSLASKDKDKEREKAKRVAACDVCRMRKVKCVKADDSPIVDGKPQRCQGCIELNRDCSYNYMPKKPGPPNPYAKPPAAGSHPTTERFTPYPPPTPTGVHRSSTLPSSTPSFERNASSSTIQSLGPRASSSFAAVPLPQVSSGPAPPYPMSPPSMPFGAFLNPQIQPISKQPPEPGYLYPPSASRGRTDDFTSFGSGGIDGGRGGHAGDQRGLSENLPPGLMSLEQSSPRVMGLSAPHHEYSPAKSLPGSVNGFNEEDSLFMPWIVGATPPSFPPSTVGAMTSIPTVPHALFMSGMPDGSLPDRGDTSVMDWANMTGGEDLLGLHSDLPSLVNQSHNQGRGGGSSVPDAVALGLDGNSPFGSHGGLGFMGLVSDERGSNASQTHSHQGVPSMPSGWQTYSHPASSGSVGTPLHKGKEEPSLDLPYLEDVTSWSTIMTFLSLYHEHLYPLLPLMHWPSFSQQLIARHDRRDTVFRAFVLSLVAYSILQLPRSVIPERYSQRELLLLHKRCHEYSQRLQPKTYDPAELIHVSTLYCDHIYLGSMGKDNAANVVLAEAMRLAIAMGLHDETVASNVDFNEIDRETRRRVFWVLYGSDRTIAALISCPMLLSDEDVLVGDILAVDDDLITAAGAFPQPSGRTPVLAGFLHVTRIFRLLSRVLQLVRRCARPVNHSDECMVDPRSLIQSLQNLLDDLPPALRINGRIEEPRNRTDTVAFDTCKANILVTQVLVRFAIYQYAILKQQGRPDQCLDELTEDVLRRLHSMSSESLAANGESIRHKVLFIASSLLNKYPSDNAGHDHVSEFLGVYNKILTNQSATGVEPRNAMDNASAGDRANGTGVS